MTRFSAKSIERASDFAKRHARRQGATARAKAAELSENPYDLMIHDAGLYLAWRTGWYEGYNKGHRL